MVTLYAFGTYSVPPGQRVTNLSHRMPRSAKPPIKAACLACRTSKTRCDGQQPCGSCSGRNRNCNYQPSRRGGARRGVQYEQMRRSAGNSLPPSSLSDVTDGIEPFPEMSLVTPFAGIHNLDLSPDSLSADEAHQIWGQLTPHSDSPYDSTSLSYTGIPLIRSYQSEADIANAYYLYIHPYLPLLPPPTEPQYEDRPKVIRAFGESSEPAKSNLPYWPASSLSLAISAMLVLIPVPEDQFPTADLCLTYRRSYAQIFAQAALTAVETEIDDLSPPLASNIPESERCRGPEALHPRVPARIYPVLALVALSVYEYCQRGNVSRMRARGNQAMTTAMDISIHNLDASETTFSEAQRRAWWMTPPIISSDDPRITTPYPKFNVFLEPWPMVMKSQEVMFQTNKMVQSIERANVEVVPSEFGAQIRKLDSLLVTVMRETDRHTLITFNEEPEASVAQIMWMISRMLIHASRTRLHRFRAFMDIPLFLDQYCDLASINSQGVSHDMSKSKWVTECEVAFPFTEQESSMICLKSSLVVSTIFRTLPFPSIPGHTSSSSIRYPKTVPYFACSAMQSSYALLMLLHRVRASLATDRLANCYHLLNGPSPESEIADAERLTEELRHGVETLAKSLKSDVIFEGVGDMGREIEGAYQAAFPSCSEN
ncbi:unnamed protein product [Penicillium salamii]|uniref:Zn(2)-C6 fungal-type domain-containing protein n=1 Tax=Penicillium salamii TaxID=1612424 RepID=A0A9W4IFS2_9EURO|nr:unnamed protein product [Penicillium salamii]CAG8253262.1 unnamed protein product [Penicillium salamii]CAG8276961.1 unnamed protein product [Penicillium salamii]CAG8295541.1 unnamed protein product [Penicillium salamii]CAG8389430.1 unnamed protein product [Penicillium salamii]